MLDTELLVSDAKENGLCLTISVNLLIINLKFGL